MKTIGELKECVRDMICDEGGEIADDKALCKYITMASRMANKEINLLGQDFFTTCEDIEVKAGDKCVSLPDDVLKLKKVSIIDSSGKCCDLDRLGYDCNQCKSDGGKPTGYQFFNKKGEGAKLYLLPLPNADFTIRLIYTRKACDVDENTDDSTLIEPQECCDFIFWATMYMLGLKEKSPALSQYVASMNNSLRLLRGLMNTQFDDGQDCIMDIDDCELDYLNEC